MTPAARRATRSCRGCGTGSRTPSATADGDASAQPRATFRRQLDSRWELSDGSARQRAADHRGALRAGRHRRHRPAGDRPHRASRWITNFEPNYLAAIDFYDEDFPWRYTPVAPDTPGIGCGRGSCCVVLEEDEFEDGTKNADGRCRYITVAMPHEFPPADELWAWAHVHVNADVAEAE